MLGSYESGKDALQIFVAERQEAVGAPCTQVLLVSLVDELAIRRHTEENFLGSAGLNANAALKPNNIAKKARLIFTLFMVKNALFNQKTSEKLW